MKNWLGAYGARNTFQNFLIFSPIENYFAAESFKVIYICRKITLEGIIWEKKFVEKSAVIRKILIMYIYYTKTNISPLF